MRQMRGKISDQSVGSARRHISRALPAPLSRNLTLRAKARQRSACLAMLSTSARTARRPASVSGSTRPSGRSTRVHRSRTHSAAP